MFVNLNLNNYSFYKIVCKDPSIKDCYIGRTQCLIDRINGHMYKCKESNIYLYQFIRENGGWENFEVIELHRAFCDDKTANFVEYNFMISEKATLNKQSSKSYPRQNYNTQKCREHYQIKKTCACCDWVGSKMLWSKHLNSKKHMKAVYDSI